MKTRQGTNIGRRKYAYTYNIVDACVVLVTDLMQSTLIITACNISQDCMQSDNNQGRIQVRHGTYYKDCLAGSIGIPIIKIRSMG